MNNAQLQTRLEAALAARGPDYVPRTRYKDDTGKPEYLNRLILEDSPYLLQHAHNPVDWYAWSEEAFAAARAADKPLFLSIGYATCHWCHVMEEESFDNREVAKHLNENYICIKVDREQRPDIDHYYMIGLLLIAGGGGWPMSSFLTPEAKPFFAGTYFPAPQFVQLLDQIAQTWRDKREALTEQAQRVDAAIVATQEQREQAGQIDQALIDRAVADSLSRFDSRLGGFGNAPKFPMESTLLLLLDYSFRQPDERVTQAACYSLQAMADGGIHDQIGGGFHRYSVDSHWLVPHFEKMLYNQAQLGSAYLQAWRLTGAGYFRRVATQLLDYVCREMQAPDGGFYSATDADSEGEEGRFFVWTPEQVQATLPGELAERALDLYAIRPGGNFEGRSIPSLPVSLSDYAEQNKLDLPGLLREVDAIRELLYQAREQREHPILDNKIIVAWNGQMITTLAQAGQLLDEPRYLDAARRSAETLWQTARREDGNLWRVILDGQASTPAMQEDYAAFALACTALYDATGATDWLARAEQLVEHMTADFADPQGGFYMNPPQGEPPLPRLKDITDAATPSSNALALRALSQLWHRSGEPAYQQQAEKLLAAFSGQLQHNPTAHTALLLAAAEFTEGETGPMRYAGQGVVQAQGRYRDGRLSVSLKIRDGWHINGASPADPARVPTQLALDDAPDCALSEIRFQPDQDSLGGEVQLTAVLTGSPPALLKLNLTLQPCSGDHCLAPETLPLWVMTQAPAPATDRDPA